MSSTKYDRQLRLWGDEAQERLAKTTVLCVGANGLAMETLKNLLLPGVGRTLIVDDCIVSAGDLHSNFAFTEKDVGCRRSEALANYLRTLNEEVEVATDVGDSHVDVVIITLPDASLVKVYSKRYPDIPLVWTVSMGFLGFAWITAKKLLIRDAKSTEPMNLCLTRPHPRLAQLARDTPWPREAEDDKLNWPILLLKAKTELVGDTQLQASDRAALMQILDERRTDATRLQFDEAATFAYSVLTPPGIPERFQHLARFVKSTDALDGVEWEAVRLLVDFVESHGYLPCNGRLPDMASSTDTYGAMRRLYSDWAHEEIADYSFDHPALLKRFFGKASQMGVLNSDSIPTQLTKMEVGEDEGRAVLSAMLVHLGCSYEAPKSADVFSRSLCIPGGSEEIHVTSAMLGGVASQEVVKLATGTFMPLEGAFVWNGWQSRGYSFKPA
ncbi:MAG: uncharacterized protein KVP18_004548 [Porospora cf. gigantea A]|uniref:uncharacterized protein n=1 Tax=Porospora cf. gigantea A TaxID=2853593 RepID=UPI00355A1D49|nr:MAG: hypothetical protein KVP18_004548 [Porospora cf. gigantea A]